MHGISALIIFFCACSFIAPIEGIGLIVWWIVEEIVTNSSTWWQFHTESLAVVLTEWAVVILVLIGLNWWMHPLVINEPRNRYAKRVLGFFFKLTPKSYQPSDLEQSKTHHEVPVCISSREIMMSVSLSLPLPLSLSQVEEAKYRPYFLDDTERKGGTSMPSQQSRQDSRSSVTPEKRSVAYSEEEL